MRTFVVAVFSFAFPGFGAALARQNRAMLAWLAAAIVAALASLVSVWLLPLVFAVRSPAPPTGCVGYAPRSASAYGSTAPQR